MVPAAGASSASRNHLEAQAWLGAALPARDPVSARVPQRAGRLDSVLSPIARLIKANVGMQVAVADVTGWDTHVGQGGSTGRLAVRLDELARGLVTFARDLGERLRDVVVVTVSEFGRTVRENGAGGTDHGRATAMLILGGPVRGGRMLGQWPGLDPAERPDAPGVAVTTDARDLLAEWRTA